MSVKPPRKLDFFAGLLSFLIPGLGQVYQGRAGKGLLFLVSLYALFFYGMWLGKFKNVYLPRTDTRQNVVFSSTPLADVENRLHFAGQFWIGVASWPALVQYSAYDDKETRHKILGTWQRAPKEEELNALQRNGDKRWDLGWVYTVIAGVLNILVIYDAVAGPAVPEPAATTPSKDKEPVAS